MQRRQAIEIKLTDINMLIFHCYEDARPQAMDGTRLVASYSATQLSHEESLFAKVAANAADALIQGEMGAILGQTGVAAAVAHATGRTLMGHIFTRAQQNKLVPFVNLNYLEPVEFPDNGNIGSTPKLGSERTAALRKLYHHTLTYQNLKGTRPGFKLFGFKVGEYRDDNLIDDPKYLVNILIGRKLRFAAQARSKAECELHLKHLLDFLDRIVKQETITHSKSTDTNYLSIRSVINMIRKELGEQEDRELIEENKAGLLVKLKNDIQQLIKSTQELFKTITHRITRLTSDISPSDYENYNPNNAITKKLPVSLEIAKANTYPNTLVNALYAKDTTALDVELFIKGLKEYAGLHEIDNADTLKRILTNLVTGQQTIKKLLGVLNNLKTIEDAAGENTYIILSEELRHLLQKIKTSLLHLIRNQKAFVDALSKHASTSTAQKFKDAFTQNGYQRLTLDIQPINEAIIALDHISLNKDEIKGELDLRIQELIAQFREATKQCGYQPTDQAPVEAAELAIDTAADDDTAMKDWIEINLDQPLQQSQAFEAKLSSEVKDLPLYKDIAEHIKTKRALEDNVTLLKQNEAALEMLKQENDSKQAKLLINDKLDRYHATFKTFINDYIDRNKASSIWNLFGHFHGFHGRDVATFMLREFDDMIIEIRKSDQLTDVDLQAVIQDRFISLLIRSRERLDGNFNPHSLKTYLLAYANFLDKGNLDTDPNTELKTFHQDAFVGKKRNIMRLYREITSTEETSLKPINHTKYSRQ